jgi:hypothetical protein
MGKYKVVKNGRNLWGRETFRTKREAQDSITQTNIGARLLRQKSKAQGARIIKINQRKR